MSKTAMKFCSECGNPLGEGARFCGKCGARIAPEETGPASAAAPSVQADKAPADTGESPGDELGRAPPPGQPGKKAASAPSAPAPQPAPTPPPVAASTKPPAPPVPPAGPAKSPDLAAGAGQPPAQAARSGWLIWALAWAAAWGIGALAGWTIFSGQIGGSLILVSSMPSMGVAVLTFALIFSAGGFIAGALSGWSLAFANGHRAVPSWPAASVTAFCWLVILLALATVSGEKLSELPGGSGVVYALLLHFYFAYASGPAGLILSAVGAMMAKPAAPLPAYRSVKLAAGWAAASIAGGFLVVGVVALLLGSFEIVRLAG